MKYIRVGFRVILKAVQDQIATDLQSALYQLPNIPNDNVPDGFTEEDNEVVQTSGEIPELHEESLPHWDLIKKYDIIDFDFRKIYRSFTFSRKNDGNSFRTTKSQTMIPAPSGGLIDCLLHIGNHGDGVRAAGEQ